MVGQPESAGRKVDERRDFFRSSDRGKKSLSAAAVQGQCSARPGEHDFTCYPRLSPDAKRDLQQPGEAFGIVDAERATNRYLAQFRFTEYERTWVVAVKRRHRFAQGGLVKLQAWRLP